MNAKWTNFQINVTISGQRKYVLLFCALTLKIFLVCAFASAMLCHANALVYEPFVLQLSMQSYGLCDYHHRTVLGLRKHSFPRNAGWYRRIVHHNIKPLHRCAFTDSYMIEL